MGSEQLTGTAPDQPIGFAHTMREIAGSPWLVVGLPVVFVLLLWAASDGLPYFKDGNESYLMYVHAWALLNEYTSSDSLVKHMLAVEAAMRAYARRGNHDETLWGITGLLHDFDYERWPNPNLDTTGHPFPQCCGHNRGDPRTLWSAEFRPRVGRLDDQADQRPAPLVQLAIECQCGRHLVVDREFVLIDDHLRPLGCGPPGFQIATRCGLG